MVSGNLFNRSFWVRDRVGHREEVVRRLEEFLGKRDKDSLVALVDILWASEAVTDREKAVERRVMRRGFTPEYVAEKLKLVKVDPQRLIEEDIPGFGPASITELLFCIDPENFTIFNRRSRKFVKDLGYGDFDKERFNLKTYERFKEAEKKIFQEFKVLKDAIERKLGISIPKFDFVDGLASLLYEGKITIEELRDLKRGVILEVNLDDVVLKSALDSIYKAVKQYLYWLGRGDPEERAIEKAASYAAGVLASSESLDIQGKHAFMLALESISKISKEMADMLRELS